MKYNRGEFEGAADEFLKWRKSNGVVLAGLVRRREAERALFLS
jgi:GH24 family phage-related lysozyme (muramidase)